jgi:hypothetical protein
VTFYRIGGSTKAINRQYDCVYADAAGQATGWLPISKGDTIAVNIARASIVFGNAASSVVTMSPIAPEATVLMEMRMFGADAQVTAWPVDQWQNMVVATSRRAHRAGWVRLRILAINAGDGTGINMALQISRTGDVGAQT